MRFSLFVFALFLATSVIASPTIRQKQMSYTRVREAYNNKEKLFVKNLAEHSISRDSMRIYLRAFKSEKKLELWAKNIDDSVYTCIRVLPICDFSGDVGPKRRSHDLQTPEGFYRINELNPYSRYYLSMRINYPNASDSIRGTRGRLGNEIYIHGDCISSGCLAMTDDRISELYIYCVEAYNCGQENIAITIYPAELTDANYNRLITRYSKYKDEMSLWADLKKSYDQFEKRRMPPAVKFLPDGTHVVGLSAADSLIIERNQALRINPVRIIEGKDSQVYLSAGRRPFDLTKIALQPIVKGNDRR